MLVSWRVFFFKPRCKLGFNDFNDYIFLSFFFQLGLGSIQPPTGKAIFQPTTGGCIPGEAS